MAKCESVLKIFSAFVLLLFLMPPVAHGLSASPSPSPSSSPFLSISAPYRVLNNCTEITSPGIYNVQSDLRSVDGGWGCLKIHDTHDVVIQCNGHLVSGFNSSISITNSVNIAVRNCKTIDQAPTSFSAYNARAVEFSGNSVHSSMMSVRYSDTVIIYGNTFLKTPYLQIDSSNSLIEQNHFDERIDATHGKEVGSAIGVSGGYNQRVIANWMHGGAANPFQFDNPNGGTDDGIFIENVSNATISGNAIYNFWDCGIESEGLISHSSISGNYMANIGIAAIGAWYDNEWDGNLIQNNVAIYARTLFRLYYYKMYGTGQRYWRNNLFEGNRITGCDTIGCEMSLLSSVAQNASNNHFNSNNFGPRTAPSISSNFGAVDHYNNRCGTYYPTYSGFRLQCVQ